MGRVEGGGLWVDQAYPVTEARVSQFCIYRVVALTQGLLQTGQPLLCITDPHASHTDVWVPCRSPPGTVKEGLAEQLGLVAKEVSIVMTDVQGSSRLWEW